MPVKSFRGKLEDNEQMKIPLHTNDGKTGYRIKKFVIMPTLEVDDLSAIVKLWSRKQTSVDTTIDFTDQTLLAAGLYRQDSGNNWNFAQNEFFDNVVFNQDIYITYRDDETAGKFINYYFELEQVTLDNVEQTMATLQSIRSSAQGTGQKG